MERRAISASIDRRMSERWTLSFAAGAGLPGILVIGGERHEINPGWLVAVSSSWRLADGRKTLPFFALLSLTVAASGASTNLESPLRFQSAEPGTDAASLYAFDARLGLIAGKTFFDVLTPYAGVRLFGGPVFWQFRGEDVTGSDTRHVQIALGLSSALPSGIDLFVEVAPFFERAATVGGGLSF
ncbi:MAG: hypothetical protein HUU21_08685 [Polyangiaceae bacterium]|nr:hypothetical protein [Polyangiaceae bacterium]NUQ73616.1 hypothetical protein [Polyangiaceae bacterium]